jgi:hypothetical protein
MNMPEKQLSFVKELMELSESMGVHDAFGIFMDAAASQKCNGEKLHRFNNAFMFPSVILGESDKREWVKYVVENFGLLSRYDKSWDYRQLEDHLTCEQKRDLLTKYKKDIDTFDDMEIPECR